MSQNPLSSASPLAPEKDMGNVEDELPLIPIVIGAQDPSNLAPSLPSTSRKGKCKALEIKPAHPYPLAPVVYEPDYEIMLLFSYPRSSWIVSHLYSYSYTSCKYSHSSEYIRVTSQPSSFPIGSAKLQDASVSTPRYANICFTFYVLTYANCRPEVDIHDIDRPEALQGIMYVSTASSLPPASSQSSNPPHDLCQESWENLQGMDIDESGRGNTGGIETFAKNTDAPAPTFFAPDEECNPFHELFQEALENPQRREMEATGDCMFKLGSGLKPGQGNTGGFETFGKSTDAPAPTPSTPSQEQNNDFVITCLPLPPSSQIVLRTSNEHSSAGQRTEVDNGGDVEDTGLPPSPNYKNAVSIYPFCQII